MSNRKSKNTFNKPEVLKIQEGKYSYKLLIDYRNDSLRHFNVDVRSTFCKLTKEGIIHIYEGYKWDGPTGAVNTKDFIRASMVHDALCQLIIIKMLPDSYQIKADKALKRMCIEDGMSIFRAWYVYLAVRFYQKYRRIL